MDHTACRQAPTNSRVAVCASRFAIASALAIALPTAGAQAADDLTSLKAQLDSVTQQLQTLQQQVRQAQTAAPAPAPTTKVVTQDPGNLPGRTAVPPYTANGVGTPGAVPPTPASAVSSGGNRVKLSLSGQVDRMLLFGNDGKSSNVRNVDNNQSSSRVRMVGEGAINAHASGGVNIETELRPNSSASTTLTQNLSQPASATTFTVRQAEAYMQDDRYGGVRLGFGGTASYLALTTDLSGTSIASYAGISDLNGGFAFRQHGAAQIPGTSLSSFVASPDGAYGPAVGAVFTYMEGMVRTDRIRYDSPVFHGFQFSTSAIDGGAYDAALRYSGEYQGIQLAASGAFTDAMALHHIGATASTGAVGFPATLYGYAGVPTGANGSAFLSTPASPNAGDTSAAGSRAVTGSISVLHPSGFNVTFAGGARDVAYRDPFGRKINPYLFYTKLGYRTSLFDVGPSAVSIDYAMDNESEFKGDKARAYSLAFVQTIDGAATELFVTARRETLTRSFAQYYPITVVATGARVRF